MYLKKKVPFILPHDLSSMQKHKPCEGYVYGVLFHPPIEDFVMSRSKPYFKYKIGRTAQYEPQKRLNTYHGLKDDVIFKTVNCVLMEKVILVSLKCGDIFHKLDGTREYFMRPMEKITSKHSFCLQEKHNWELLQYIIERRVSNEETYIDYENLWKSIISENERLLTNDDITDENRDGELWKLCDMLTSDWLDNSKFDIYEKWTALTIDTSYEYFRLLMLNRIAFKIENLLLDSFKEYPLEESCKLEVGDIFYHDEPDRYLIRFTYRNDTIYIYDSRAFDKSYHIVDYYSDDEEFFDCNETFMEVD